MEKDHTLAKHRPVKTGEDKKFHLSFIATSHAEHESTEFSLNASRFAEDRVPGTATLAAKKGRCNFVFWVKARYLFAPLPSRYYSALCNL